MIDKLLVRQRRVLGQPVWEPTLLLLALTALALLFLLAVVAVAFYCVATCGFGWLAFAAVTAVLAARGVSTSARAGCSARAFAFPGG